METLVLEPTAKTTPTKPRTVPLYTWWKNSKGTRTFALINKNGKGVGYDYRTTEVELLEVGHTSPITYPIGQFFDLVDRGSLIEMKPETTINVATDN